MSGMLRVLYRTRAKDAATCLFDITIKGFIMFTIVYYVMLGVCLSGCNDTLAWRFFIWFLIHKCFVTETLWLYLSQQRIPKLKHIVVW